MQELLIVGLYIYILSNLAQYLVIMFLFWVFIFILDLIQENLSNLFQGYVCCKHAQNSDLYVYVEIILCMSFYNGCNHFKGFLQQRYLQQRSFVNGFY